MCWTQLGNIHLRSLTANLGCRMPGVELTLEVRAIPSFPIIAKSGFDAMQRAFAFGAKYYRAAEQIADAEDHDCARETYGSLGTQLR
jgi:hypothetical protein